MIVAVEAGTDEQHEVVERIQLLLNETLPDFIQQHIVLALLLASHALRASNADDVIDNMHKHVRHLIKNYDLQQPGETRQ
jgi:hypothetical protein